MLFFAPCALFHFFPGLNGGFGLAGITEFLPWVAGGAAFWPNWVGSRGGRRRHFLAIWVDFRRISLALCTFLALPAGICPRPSREGVLGLIEGGCFWADLEGGAGNGTFENEAISIEIRAVGLTNGGEIGEIWGGLCHRPRRGPGRGPGRWGAGSGLEMGDFYRFNL